MSKASISRVLWIVLDSVGIGPLPDAADYGDAGRDTLGHIARSRPLRLPNLARLGLGNIAPLDRLPPAAAPLAGYGRGATRSPGKDTTTGHWEMAGIWLERAFPLYPHGFPAELMAEFERQIGRDTLGNKPASGTEILKELGAEHLRTGRPIVYTSADSVFQIAAHEDVIPVAELYRMCEIARRLLDGPHRVGRVIARPFAGPPGDFRRTERRHDYAVEPPRPMLPDVLADRGVPVLGIGKIHDIYHGRGVESYITTKSNLDGMEKIAAAVGAHPRGLIFANLVDFDMLYGHRKDVEGFARSRSSTHGWARSCLGSGRRICCCSPPTTGAIPVPARLRPTIRASTCRFLPTRRRGLPGATSAPARRWRIWGRQWRRFSAARLRTGGVSWMR